MTSAIHYYASALSNLIPIGIFIYRFKSLTVELKALAAFLIFSVIVEVINFIAGIYKINNVLVFNLFTIVEGFVLFLLVGRWFNSRYLYKFTMILLFMYCIYWVYTTFVTANIWQLNTKELTVKSIALIFLYSLLIFRLAKNQEVTIIHDYRLWISFAVLFYFAISLIIFATATFLIEGQRQALHYSWIIHSFVNIFANLLVAYGFICYFRKRNLFT